MSAAIHLEGGERYGMLRVLEEATRSRGGDRRFKCVCDCGAEVVVYLRKLRTSERLSCGKHPRRRSARRPTLAPVLTRVYADEREPLPVGFLDDFSSFD